MRDHSPRATKLFHLIPSDDLKTCKAKGSTYKPRTYEQDKFTHLTAKPELLLDVANHFYKRTSGDWLLLVLDASKLKAEVKYEPAAPVGNTAAKSSKPDETIEIFPHLYGGINLDAILSELPVERDSSGTFLSIQGL